jgi:hypothetical protein
MSRPTSDMEEESRFGAMEVSMRDTGRIIRQMAGEGSLMQTETFMKESGLMIRNKDLESTNTAQGAITKENGRKISSMAKERKDLPMEIIMKAYTKWD